MEQNKITDLINRLNRYSLEVISYKMDADFADACEGAVAALEKMAADLEAAEECVNTISEQFDKGACHDDYAEEALEKWYSRKP